MNQPDLGKKIAELRKAKGLTQDELVEKCNISVRTLQRIESGEVMPRSYTIKIIFANLEYTESLEIGKTEFSISHWLEQIYRYLLDLFNLKINTMKKITILSITFFAIIFGLFVLCTDSKAQKAEKAIKVLEESQKKINKWVNSGQVDSILTFYREDASISPYLTGKSQIREAMKLSISSGNKIIESQILSTSVGDSIAVQKIYNVIENSGVTHKQQGLSEWRLTNGKWLKVNSIMIDY